MITATKIKIKKLHNQLGDSLWCVVHPTFGTRAFLSFEEAIREACVWACHFDMVDK